MKNIVMYSLLLVFGFFSAFGQEKTASKGLTPEKIAEIQTGKMAELYQLTSDQKTAIYAVNLETAKKIHELAESSASVKERKAFQAQIYHTQQESIRQVLTTAQQSVFDESITRYNDRQSQAENQ